MKIDPADFAGATIPTKRAAIVIGEPDGEFRQAVRQSLQSDGFETRVFGNGPAALAAFEAAPPDLALLNIALPGLDGFDLLREIRERWTLPVILVTERHDDVDELLALRLGADDFLRKPVSLRLLTERIRTRLRRAPSAAGRSGGAGPAAAMWEKVLDRGPLKMDAERHAVSWKGAEVVLTVTEFALLEALAKRPGHVKSREQLMDIAYSDQVYVDDRTIDSHIKRLRKKLRHVDPHFAAIETLYGIGYRYAERDGLAAR